jgi:DNA (cytosine-5)-methyltransferase 1
MYKILSVKEIKQTPQKDIKIISLFGGGGGSSTGYRMGGGNVLLANEITKLAADVYKANWNETVVVRKDIRTINPLDILKEINLPAGELDILDGSPPCCCFSIAGKREKGWGKEKTLSGGIKQKNTEDLFYEYIRFVKNIQPKVFIAENVKGLAAGNAKGYFNDILRKLKECGYYTECRLINAAYLGVPQKRERLIFVGVRNDLMKKEYEGRIHPKPVNKFIPLREAFGGLIYDKNEIFELEERIKKYSIYPSLIDGGTGKRCCRKADPSFPSNTITASMDISQRCLKHWGNRPFTIGELKRIQSLPDDYILLGSYRRQAETIGLMVPPLVAKALLNNLIEIGILKNKF